MTRHPTPRDVLLELVENDYRVTYYRVTWFSELRSRWPYSSPQTISGALRYLRARGLADCGRFECSDETGWWATDAAAECCRVLGVGE